MGAKENPSPWCPTNCNFQGVSFVCAGCGHARDVVFKNPESIQIRTGSGWKTAKVLGRNGNKLIIEEGENTTEVSIHSPLLK